MPYSRNSELPAPVRNSLPDKAQSIFRKAFNSAYERYAGTADQEARSMKVAWAAVKRTYEKSDGRWVRKRRQ